MHKLLTLSEETNSDGCYTLRCCVRAVLLAAPCYCASTSCLDGSKQRSLWKQSAGIVAHKNYKVVGVPADFMTQFSKVANCPLEKDFGALPDRNGLIEGHIQHCRQISKTITINVDLHGQIPLEVSVIYSGISDELTI